MSCGGGHLGFPIGIKNINSVAQFLIKLSIKQTFLKVLKADFSLINNAKI
jgi:hypothetical protein